MEDPNAVTDESQTAETETAAPSTSEEQTTPEAEKSEVATSEQPAEEGNRAQDRIRELARQKKEAEQRAAYWEAYNAPSEPQKESESEDSEGVTVDDIVNKIDQRLAQREAQKRKHEAEIAMREDALNALASYPELQEDDDLLNAVFGLAQQKGITIKSAAGTLIGKLRVREAQVQAESGLKGGSATPTGSAAFKGEQPPIDIDNLSDEERKNNWGKVIDSYARR